MSQGVIIIGVSAGGFQALETIFRQLKSPLMVPLLIVQHMSDDSGQYLCEHLESISGITVIPAEDKKKAQPGVAYIAPGGYHLLLDEGMLMELSVDERTSNARPSIDVLFESAADVTREHTVAIILTGANTDGTSGVKVVKSYGGFVIAENPKTAEYPIMPLSAVNSGCVDLILSLDEIAEYINKTWAIKTASDSDGRTKK